MLIEFRVKNFRSVKEEQTLSLVADKDKTHDETHVIEGNVSTPNLLKSAVIYGPNASGKSNLIKAMYFMQRVVADSATKMNEGQKFDCPYFKLDAKFKDQPSEFEVTFIDQGIRYQYGFSLVAERVIEEWLLVYITAKPQKWFTRHYDPKSEKDIYEFSSHLTGQRALWQESTRSNALFLSKAVDLNSDRLRPIFLWIVQNLIIIPDERNFGFDFSINYALKAEGKIELLQFLKAADLSIADMKLENKKMKQTEVYFEDGKRKYSSIDVERNFPLFIHQAENGSATFEFFQESLGTQRMFTYAGPMLDVLKNGRVIVIDELDSSLHSLMVRFLIGQFHSSQNNVKGAQLIFSTHDTALLDTDLFRRDQVWLMEKDRSQATKLYPLTDFSPRKNEALNRGYLMGRYGALPFFTDFNLINTDESFKNAPEEKSKQKTDNMINGFRRSKRRGVEKKHGKR